MPNFDITFPFTYQPEIDGVFLFEQNMSAEIEADIDLDDWSVMGIAIHGLAWTADRSTVVSTWVELPDLPGHNGSLYKAIEAFLHSPAMRGHVVDALAAVRPSIAALRTDAARNAYAGEGL